MSTVELEFNSRLQDENIGWRIRGLAPDGNGLLDCVKTRPLVSKIENTEEAGLPNFPIG